ncbi:MAG TPA: hypothetical protein VFP36_06125 [Usitatibacter sp.]|nr:hypothetical protein [Usitatibacter sp.]
MTHPHPVKDARRLPKERTGSRPRPAGEPPALPPDWREPAPQARQRPRYYAWLGWAALIAALAVVIGGVAIAVL